jgi:tetratricopeptide (TPR) repeat protein
MAALNAAGLDVDADSGANHPLRATVRKHLAGKQIPVLPQLRQFVYDHRQSDSGLNLAQYVSFALVHDDPPEFKPLLLGVEVPPDVQTLTGFRELMVRFHREAGIEDLWQRAQGVYEQALERYHEPVSRVLLETNAYLRNPTSGYMGRRFQVLVDLLAPPNQVHTRSYKEDYFIVLTPAAEQRTDDVRHAYLHYLLDPLAAKYSERVLRARGLGDYAEGAPALEEAYKADFLLLATESLIKAVESRLNRNPSLVEQALKEGFVLTPFFAEQLPRYEKQDSAIRLFLPEMLDAVDLKKEDRRLQKVQFAAAKAVKKAATAPIPPEQKVSAAEQGLENAEKQYAARNLEAAREAYLKLVRENEEQNIRARSYFGLGRVAALKNEPELAEQLFRKTLELSPDAYTRSWTEVYLGRLAEGFGEKERAVQHFKSALSVEGGPQGARQAAEQGIQKLAPQ